VEFFGTLGRTMRTILTAIVLLTWVAAAWGLDHVVFRRDGKEQRVSGQIVVKAQDGGLMLMGADGRLWTVPPEELTEHRADETPFVAQSAEDAGKAMLKQLPDGFEVYTTAHYVICHGTSRAYAQWCGALYERLYSGFINFWSRKGFKLREPKFPLVCVIFPSQESYTAFARDELGEATGHIIAYYSLRTNRVTMFDLTGLEALRRPGDRKGSTAQINLMLARPDAERMVATIIHEATHQIAFNCGLQTRFADIPLWFSEGVAMYFEAPDLSNSKGWKTIGEVNLPRLRQFREAAQPTAESLVALITDDKRLRDPRDAPEAYAQAWALHYFLIRHKPKEYLSYLEELSQKGPLVWDEPQERLNQFKRIFGDLEKLAVDFARQMQKVR
jgi:hypothetical protein